MPHQMIDRLQLGAETTRGTAVTATAEFGFTEVLKPTIANHQGEVMASSTFPYKTDNVPVGVTWGPLTFTVDLNVNNIRDIFLMATKRTSGVLPSFTVIHGQAGVGVARYVGCVVESLALQMSRSAAPDGSSILQAVITMQCMLGANGAGALASLTPAVGRHFTFNKGTINVNNVAATKLTSLSLTINNQLSLGPPDSANTRLWLEDGHETHDYNVAGQFTSTAYRALVEGGTEAATNTLIFATGTSNETVTGTIGKAQIISRGLSDQDGTQMEEIAISPHHTGAAAPIVWTFGSAVGAAVLMA